MNNFFRMNMGPYKIRVLLTKEVVVLRHADSVVQDVREFNRLKPKSYFTYHEL